MKVLMKLGGTLLDQPAKRASMARQLVWSASQCDLVVVHGGGKQVTQYLEDRGVNSEFVNGLRVSDETVISAVVNVIAGGVNKQLVAAVLAEGAKAVGLSGVDGGLIQAEKLSERLLFTGKPVNTDCALLDLLIGGGYLPIVACIAGDAAGHIYNVNADQLAVSCAAGWRADKLFFLTDVPGVKSGTGEVLSQLAPDDVEGLVSSGVAHGGMQAKLEASLWALRNGLEEVVIAPGQAENICVDLLSGAARGTSIKSQKERVA